MMKKDIVIILYYFPVLFTKEWWRVTSSSCHHSQEWRILQVFFQNPSLINFFFISRFFLGHSLRSYQDLDFKTHFQKYIKCAYKKCLPEFFFIFPVFRTSCLTIWDKEWHFFISKYVLKICVTKPYIFHTKWPFWPTLSFPKTHIYQL